MDLQRIPARAVRGVLVALLGLSGVLTGCSHWRPDVASPTPRSQPGNSSRATVASWPQPPDTVPAAFAYTNRHGRLPEVFQRLAGERGSYRVWELSMPSVGDNGQPDRRVEARYFESTRPGAKRLVVILPIYGKSHYPSRKLARILTRERDAHHLNVLMLTGEANLYRPERMEAAHTGAELVAEIGDTAERMRVSVVDTLRLIDWAAARPEVEPGRIGVAGFSFSAVLASLVMAFDERVGAGVFFMGGGHIHEIFAHCHGNQVADARQVLTRRLGWSEETFAERLEPVLAPVDPMAYIDRLRDRPILLADSPVDRVIPERSSRDFWEALDRPERLILRFSHRTAFLSMTPLGANYANRKIRTFFFDNL